MEVSPGRGVYDTADDTGRGRFPCVKSSGISRASTSRMIPPPTPVTTPIQIATSGPLWARNALFTPDADKYRQTNGIKHRQHPFRQSTWLAHQQNGQHAGDHRHHQISGVFYPEHRAVGASAISRMVPPPTAVTTPSTSTPKGSIRSLPASKYARDSKYGGANNIQPIDKHRQFPVKRPDPQAILLGQIAPAAASRQPYVCRLHWRSPVADVVITLRKRRYLTCRAPRRVVLRRG